PAFLILGDRATDQKAAALREQLGLNRPILEQYWMFVSGFAHGDMGQSLLYRQPVGDLVLTRVPISLTLAAYAMGLAAMLPLTFQLSAVLIRNLRGQIILTMGPTMSGPPMPRASRRGSFCCATSCATHSFPRSRSLVCSSASWWAARSSSRRCSPCRAPAS